MKSSINLHIHSDVPLDGKEKIEKILDKCEEKGLKIDLSQIIIQQKPITTYKVQNIQEN